MRLAGRDLCRGWVPAGDGWQCLGTGQEWQGMWAERFALWQCQVGRTVLIGWLVIKLNHVQHRPGCWPSWCREKRKMPLSPPSPFELDQKMQSHGHTPHHGSRSSLCRLLGCLHCAHTWAGFIDGCECASCTVQHVCVSPARSGSYSHGIFLMPSGDLSYWRFQYSIISIP